MASKSMTTMVLVLAFNMILFSHLMKPAQGQVDIGLCPRGLRQLLNCTVELLGIVNVSSSGSGVTVGVGAPTGLLPRLTACCSLLTGLTDSQGTNCLRLSLTSALPGITINEQVSLTQIIRGTCNRLNQ